MSRQIIGPRKQRTRQHIIADQSVNHLERFIIDEGHTAQRLERDYGYDLLFFTYDGHGYPEPDFLAIQLKATHSLQTAGGKALFDVSIRDYNLWTMERMPVILVLFDASRKRAYWLCVQSYFREKTAAQPKKGAKTVRVRIPMQQVVNRRAIGRMRALKLEAHLRLTGENS